MGVGMGWGDWWRHKDGFGDPERRVGGWKFDTVYKIGNSAENFTTVNMGRSKAFQDQPELLQKEWERLSNVKIIEMSEPSWEDAIEALDLQKESANNEKEVIFYCP